MLNGEGIDSQYGSLISHGQTNRKSVPPNNVLHENVDTIGLLNTRYIFSKSILS